MKPGIELDVLVAKSLGLNPVYETWGKQKQYGGWSLGPREYHDFSGEMVLANPLPSYSEDISFAWDALMSVKADSMINEFSLSQDYEGLWHCRILINNGSESQIGEEHNGDTAPHAISLAILRVTKAQFDE